jgi:FKBP-type peptidyl-prolyl cis-trans isomerase
MQSKDVAKDIRSATDLEKELHLSQLQKGVCVLDVYSSEWGHCKAISETFKRLHTDAGDAVHLRFFTVECNHVLDSLKNPADSHRHQRAKNTEAGPEYWQPVLESQRGKSKPLFLFYKEGKKISVIEGVNTPAIRALVKDLCTVKTPASEFITHPKLLEFWDSQFNPEESEVAFEKFIKGLQTHCNMPVALNDDEKRVISDALGLKDQKTLVTADALQKWIGDDDATTIEGTVKALLPDYNDRAAKVLAEKEAEEKRRRDEEDAAQRRQAEDEENRRKEQEEKAKNEKAARKQQLETSIAAELRRAGYSARSEATTVDAREQAATEAVAASSSVEALDFESTVVEGEPALDLTATNGVWAFLKSKGANLKTVSAARLASSSYGGFAAKLLGASAEQLRAITGVEPYSPRVFQGFQSG